MKIGRNDPCPCGSGIKYKKCCANKQKAGDQRARLGAVTGELRELLEGQSFGSLEEANAFLSQHMQQRNQAPKDDFHGLSPEQMHRFLISLSTRPHLVTFPSCLDVAPEAPILTLFNLLVNAIGDEGVKATATGNLPRNFCREIAMAFLGEENYRETFRFVATPLGAGVLRSACHQVGCRIERIRQKVQGEVHSSAVSAGNCRKRHARNLSTAVSGPLSGSTTGDTRTGIPIFRLFSNPFCSLCICCKNMVTWRP